MRNQVWLRENCRAFISQLGEAADKLGRSGSEIKLLAVAKRRTVAEVKEVIAAGISLVGENRLQEAEAKYTGESLSVKLHMIGHLQTNKVRKAVALFDMIESIDSLKLARFVNSEAEKLGKLMPILLEVNTSGEPQKYGITPVAVEKTIASILSLRNLQLEGLMTVAPHSDDEIVVRSAFASLRKLLETIQKKYGSLKNFKTLSMGMSGDYLQALAEGSTEIRIGTAIFGPREGTN